MFGAILIPDIDSHDSICYDFVDFLTFIGFQCCLLLNSGKICSFNYPKIKANSVNATYVLGLYSQWLFVCLFLVSLKSLIKLLVSLFFFRLTIQHLNIKRLM